MQPRYFRSVKLPATTYNLCVFIRRSLNSWASAIRDASTPQESLRLHVQMQRQSIPFDSYSFLFTLKSCSRFKNLTLTHHLHAHLYKLGFSSHVYVATSLLHAYVVTSFQDARKLFDEMPERNTVSYNTMITGYFKSGDIENARGIFECMDVKDLATWSCMIAGFMGVGDCDRGLRLFGEMIKEGLKPDQATFCTMLPRCVDVGCIGLLLGKAMHGFMEKNGWKLNVEIGTALVDMYAKCGLLKSAIRVFERLEEKNVQTWSAVICGLAQHGYGREALVMFEKMKEEGVRPNEITFTGVFSACVHVGLVDEGLKNFDDMVEGYGLEPRIQHYGCVVDLLGRAGRVEEAYEVIETMKIEPNIVVWGSFLAACKLHKQFQMAEKGIKRALKLMKPENDGGTYTLIADLYAMSGKWDEAQRMRNFMINQNVKKVRGSSFIDGR
ncbi:hypothetical protein ACHQM5_016679 [Ranunculus cassubicifolius]